jgi:hypothetical protein
MFQISSLIKLHDEYSGDHLCLKDNLFDAYLYNTNRTFRNIRQVCERKGFVFSNTPSDSWVDYRACHLVNLPQMIANKVIPYADNVSFMRRLLAMDKDIELDLSFITSALYRNPLFHESGHCVADDIVFQNGAAFSTREGNAVGHLLSEAYAFCIFHFCSSDADTKESMLGCILNDIAIITPDKEVFRQSMLEFGAHGTMAAYMLSNVACLGRVPREEAPLALIAHLSGIPGAKATQPAFSDLVSLGYSVAPGFGGITQDVFYSLVNLPRPDQASVMRVFQAPGFGSYFQDVVNRLVEATV